MNFALPLLSSIYSSLKILIRIKLRIKLQAFQNFLDSKRLFALELELEIEVGLEFVLLCKGKIIVVKSYLEMNVTYEYAYEY